MSEPDTDRIHWQLNRVLASEQLAKADTPRKLLSYLVECCLRNEVPKEAAIAYDVFDRDVTFSGAEHSIVRVSVRTLRQKLIEYYAGPGEQDEIRFDIPKGGYKLVVSRNTPAAPAETALPKVRLQRLGWLRAGLVAGCLMLVASLLANLYQGTHTAASGSDPSLALIRESHLWSDIAKSNRHLTIALGDLFMYTQIDDKTGRMLTVRDPGINSSEELRILLASDPGFAAGRGQRHTTMLQKNVVLSMMAIVSLLNPQGRNIDVVACDDLTADTIRENDIIYLGPPVRLGLLVGHYEMQSRYRYNRVSAAITDLSTGKAYIPKGDLGQSHLDYALASKFVGPTGNHILIFTSGARNAGILQIVRTLTSPAGLAKLEDKLRATAANGAGSFEALLTVTGFKRTDLAADIAEVSAMPSLVMQPFIGPDRESGTALQLTGFEAQSTPRVGTSP
ncbi:MAG: hypothetical protein ABI859_14865 [Pseudomonadota bacterium]